MKVLGIVEVGRMLEVFGEVRGMLVELLGIVEVDRMLELFVEV